MKIRYYTCLMPCLLFFYQVGFTQAVAPAVKKNLFTFPDNLKHISVLGFNNPVVLHKAYVEYSMVDNGSYTSSEASSHYGDVLVISDWSVATVPFQLLINNQSWNDIANNNFSNASVHFDREVYLEQLKKKLKGKLNLQDYIATTLNNPVETLKTKAETLLKKDLEDINKNYGGGLSDQLQQVGDLKGMFSKDMLTVRQQLLNNEYIKSIEEKEKLFAELQNRKNTGQSVNIEEMKLLERDIQQLRGVKALVEKMEEHKSKWQSSGLLNKMKQLELLNKQQLIVIARNPDAISKLARQHLNLSGFQRFFLKINKLNLGQNTISASPLSVQHLLNKGINTEFLNNNRYLMLGMAKIKTVNSIFDQSFTNNLSANDGMAKMISMGLGGISSARSHVSVAAFNQSMGSLNGLPSLNTFRTSVVTTISNQINIGTKGILTTEISRSASVYKNVADTGLANKSAAQRILSSDDFFKNMAFSLKYQDEWEKQDFSYGVHVNKTALGYVNPGNTFLNSGGKELGFNMRKSFWKRQLQASVRSDMREFNYGDDRSSVWRNFYTVMDIRLRLKKGQSIGLRYMPNKMIRVENGKKSTVTFVERFSIDGNISKKVIGTYYRNDFNVSHQKNNYILGNETVLNTSWTIASFQNIVLNKKLLYVNLNYDYANNRSQYVYFNSSLLTETGLTYLLFKKVSLSSAVSYNSIEGWYQQVGFKQTITNQLNDRFNLNIYVDARKNIKIYQPLLYGLFRADISIYYLIKK